MTGDARRLQIALDLAEANLGALGEPKRRDLLHRAHRFLVSAPQGRAGEDTGGFWFGSFAPTPTDNDLQDIQLALRELIQAVTSRVPLAPFDLRLAFAPVVVGRKVLISVTNESFRDRFLLCVLTVLAQHGTSRLRSCSECGGAFVKFGRRVRCRRPECVKQWRAGAWSSYKRKHPEKVLASRKRQYDAHGWKLGARSKSKSRSRKGGRS